MKSKRLSIAQRNTALFLIVLYLQDIFWLIFSRIMFSNGDAVYNIAPFGWSVFTQFVILALIFSIVGSVSALIIRPLPEIRVSQKFINLIIISSILVNVLSFILIKGNARYISGGLTGWAGIIYLFKSALVIASFVLIMRGRQRGYPISRIWIIAFFSSYVLTIDGLANALNLAMFLFIFLDVSFKHPLRIIVLVIFSVILLWLGFNAKFSYIPEYLTPDFILRWLVARFSIQSEQAYTFLADKSIIGHVITYSDLVYRSVSNRYDLLLGNSLILEYPRSISEATFYDMQGTFGAGSSPGVFLSTIFMSWGFFIVPFSLAFLFIQYFYSIFNKVSFLQLCAYSFIFKIFHSNFSEYFTIISPTLFIVVIFIFACLATPSLKVSCSENTQFVLDFELPQKSEYFNNIIDQENKNEKE